MNPFKMTMKVVFLDGHWFVGRRELTWRYGETKGTHHFRVLDGDPWMRDLIGAKIAVPISSVQYFVLEYEAAK